MLKEIALPIDLQSFRSPFFPFADDRLDSSLSDWKREHQVHVIRHNHGQMCVPYALRIPVLDGFNNAICRDVVGKLVFPTKFAVQGNEVVRLARVNPQGNIVWQSFAIRNFHSACAVDFLVGTPRCGVRTAQRAIPTIKAV